MSSVIIIAKQLEDNIDRYNKVKKFRKVGLIILENSPYPGNIFLTDLETGESLGPLLGITVDESPTDLTVTARFRVEKSDIKTWEHETKT
jgi:hypothetical protein